MGGEAQYIAWPIPSVQGAGLQGDAQPPTDSVGLLPTIHTGDIGSPQSLAQSGAASSWVAYP